MTTRFSSFNRGKGRCTPAGPFPLSCRTFSSGTRARRTIRRRNRSGASPRPRLAQTDVSASITFFATCFDDPILTNSALDRFAHLAHQIVMEGPSLRAARAPSPRKGRKSRREGGESAMASGLTVALRGVQTLAGSVGAASRSRKELREPI